MKSCAFESARVWRLTPCNAFVHQAVRFVKLQTHSGSICKPGTGQRLRDNLCTALDVPATTHSVSLILSWLVKDYCSVGLCWAGKIERDQAGKEAITGWRFLCFLHTAQAHRKPITVWLDPADGIRENCIGFPSILLEHTERSERKDREWVYISSH